MSRMHFVKPRLTNLATDICHGKDDGFLLFRLTERRRCPADNDGVDRVGANGKDEARDVSAGSVQGTGSDDESNNGDQQSASDVPGTFMHAS